MTRPRYVPTLVLAVLTVLLAAPPAAAEEPRAEANDHLDLVPRDAKVFVSIRLADLSGQMKFTKAGRDVVKFLDELEGKLGVPVADMERITLYASDTDEFGAIVTSANKIDRDDVLKGVAPASKQVKHDNKVCHVSESKDMAVHFAGPKCYVVAKEETLARWLKQVGRGAEGPLAEAVKLARERQVVIWVDVPTLTRGEDAKDVDFTALKPMLKARSVLVTLSVGEAVEMEVRLAYKDETRAKAGAEALQLAVDLVRAQALTASVAGRLGGENVEKDVVAAAPFLTKAEKALRQAKVERDGATVSTSLRIETSARSVRDALPILAETLKPGNLLSQLCGQTRKPHYLATPAATSNYTPAPRTAPPSSGPAPFAPPGPPVSAPPAPLPSPASSR